MGISKAAPRIFLDEREGEAGVHFCVEFQQIRLTWRSTVYIAR